MVFKKHELAVERDASLRECCRCYGNAAEGLDRVDVKLRRDTFTFSMWASFSQAGRIYLFNFHDDGFFMFWCQSLYSCVVFAQMMIENAWDDEPIWMSWERCGEPCR